MKLKLTQEQKDAQDKLVKVALESLEQEALKIQKRRKWQDSFVYKLLNNCVSKVIYSFLDKAVYLSFSTFVIVITLRIMGVIR